MASPSDTNFVHQQYDYQTGEESFDDSDVDSSDDEKLDSAVDSVPSLQEALESVLKDIENGTRLFQQKEQFEGIEVNGTPIPSLLDLFAEDKRDPRVPTALHWLATRKSDKPGIEKIGPLVSFLVQHPRDPLSIQDNAGYTALHYAIAENKRGLVERMCLGHPKINSILSMQTHLKKNCLHLAVEKDVDFLPDLIQRAEPLTLCAKNNDGNTPLHLAVDYAHCRPNQLSVIEAIVSKCDQEMKRSEESDDDLSPVSTYNNSHLSPYRHHVESCEMAEKKRRRKEEEKRLKSHRRHGGQQSTTTGKNDHIRGENNVLPQPPTVPSDPKEDADARLKPIRRTNTLNEPFSKDAATKNGNKGSSVAHKDSSAAAKGMPVLKNGYDPRESPLENALSTKTSAATKGDVTKTPGTKDASRSKSESKKSDKDRSSHPKVTEESIRSIRRFLKQHYLRGRDHDSALDILYGKNSNPDIQINFDLFGYSQMTQQTLNKKLKYVKFDDTLQYVAIPNIKIEGNVNYANTGKPLALSASAAAAGNGRADLELVFHWLRRDKHVQTILKIIVNDLESPAHGDEAIERALRGSGLSAAESWDFGIETWDWRKIDLCTEVIRVAAPRAQVVHLYWSGNNAVLRGWSEQGGLKQLECLQTVHIHAQQGLDSYDRALANFNSFKESMRTLYAGVNVIPHGLERKVHKVAFNQIKPAKELTLQPPPHEWIKCMASFKKLLLEAEANLERNHGISIQEQIAEPIKVALIDDGIDINELQYTPIGGRSFCPRDEDGDTLSFPWHYSSSGHGTVMASQIYRICPRAQLYVLKLEDHINKKTGRYQITAQSATKAIRAAVRKKVHIISMSWTIDPTELQDDKVKARLETAIAEAVSANILIFCSSHDNAPKEDNTYPAAAAKHKIFKIGAARASGQTDESVSNSPDVKFTFPGNEVEMEGVSLARQVEYRTGSSVATALAAGLAALILYCVQTKLYRATQDERPKIEQAFTKLKKYEGMFKAFKSIGMTEDSNGKYIAVWDTFGKQVRNRETAGKDPYQLVDLVAAVGQEICIKI